MAENVYSWQGLHNTYCLLKYMVNGYIATGGLNRLNDALRQRNRLGSRMVENEEWRNGIRREGQGERG